MVDSKTKSYADTMRTMGHMDMDFHRLKLEALETCVQEMCDAANTLTEVYDRIMFHDLGEAEQNVLIARFGGICLNFIARDLADTLAAHDAAREPASDEC